MENNFTLPGGKNRFIQIESKPAIFIIAFVSSAAIIFLFWLIYFNETAQSFPFVEHLSTLNAALNFTSTILLILGYREIKRRNYRRHMKYMLSAFVSSSLFLISYIIYHHFVGDTKFLAEGLIRYIYFSILISHIILSVFLVPMVLSSFYFSLSGKFRIHKKLSRVTLPVWLYVSVTGVLIFLILNIFNPS